MSYIANIQGKKESNPISEINTKYTYTTGHTPQSGAPDGEHPFETPSGQNMYNDEPISQYDTEYNNSYRSTLELLRTKTESMNMALESALVPNIIKGQALLQKERYIFNDTICPVSTSEYVFRVNMVKFKSDRHKRLCYNKTVHIYTQDGDTISSIIANSINNMQYNTFIQLNPILSGVGLTDPLDSGIDIDTGIPSTVYNLVELGYIFPFMGFLNGKAIPWTKLIICVDHIDTFAIFDTSEWDQTLLPEPDSVIKSTFTYLDLPFQVKYVPRFTDCEDKYLNKTPIFWFGYTDGFVRSDEEYESNVESFNNWNRNNGFERIFTNDNHIIYEEFEMDSNSFQDISTTKFGTLYNKRFADFDYRFKIKRFNMLCFEVPEERPDSCGEIRDDFQVESHQFNILKITLDRILTNKRRFKIFYNTRVMYDQDNMLRIKNKQYLADQFAQYMKDVSSNIQVFIDETYALMKKDIGCYVDTSGKEFWYDVDMNKFTYIELDGSKTTLTIDKEDLDELNILRPSKSYFEGDNPYLTQKYPDQEYDQLKMRTEIVHFNNMEEGSTPTDEFIYYHNQLCGVLLKELAKQIFVNDQQIIIDTINDLIDRAYIENYNAIEKQEIGVSYKNEWFIRKNLPEMFIYDLNDDYILSDMGLLDEVFDFTYNDSRTYKENLIHGLQYVIGYDADKLEASILRSIVSRTMTGSEVKEFINNNILTMSRGICTYPNNNYVMIFKNGELYSKYDSILYDTLNFKVNMIPDTDVIDTDVFEFVFYLNVNNEVFPLEYKNITVPFKIKNGIYELGSTTSIDAIPCNTTLFTPENLMVLIDKIPDGMYNDHINFNTGLTAYNLNFKIMSYRELLKGFTNTTKAVSLLKDDNMINGLYRVTKQGGGEYFILPSIKPITTTEDPGNVPSSLKGIDAYAFANCGSINGMSFTGTVEEWNAISKADDWNSGMQLVNINHGNIQCSDGLAPL